jgi:glycerol-3-phosphate dehydrogenase (NAD(P)+)
MVAEGVDTTFAAMDLADRLGIEMPITCQMREVLAANKSAQDAIRHLMDRQLKGE